jgi:hypothetical protein
VTRHADRLVTGLPVDHGFRCLPNWPRSRFGSRTSGRRSLVPVHPPELLSWSSLARRLPTVNTAAAHGRTVTGAAGTTVHQNRCPTASGQKSATQAYARSVKIMWSSRGDRNVHSDATGRDQCLRYRLGPECFCSGLSMQKVASGTKRSNRQRVRARQQWPRNAHPCALRPRGHAVLGVWWCRPSS